MADDSDKPFNDKPFDAGVEVSEEDDPKKFIQQLTGKLGTSLRKYNKEQGKPDFELEKFVINSIISATHSGIMDEEDQKKIIKKVKTAGKDDNNVSVDTNNNKDDNENDDKSKPTDNKKNKKEPVKSSDEENDENTENSEDWSPTEESYKKNNEKLKNSKKSGIFEDELNNIIMNRINETFNIDNMIEEILGNITTNPQKPDEETIKKPRTDEPVKNPRPRRERIWRPEPGESPNPKARKNG